MDKLRFFKAKLTAIEKEEKVIVCDENNQEVKRWLIANSMKKVLETLKSIILLQNKMIDDMTFEIQKLQLKIEKNAN